MIPIAGYSPGGDPLTPGIITECKNMIPTVRGMKSAGDGEDVGADALPDNCQGAVMMRKIDSSARVIAGTIDALYEWASGSWLDRSKFSGYTSGANRWRFTQFGDATIAVNLVDLPQVSINTTFDDLGGTPPKAAICITAAGFVLLFDYNDGTNVFHDGWWCSALYDHTDWTPSPATQSANGRFLQSPGKITAAKSIGNGVVVYKAESMYTGQFVGPPVIWAWSQVTSDVGAYGQESVISTGDVHYFLGKHGLFMFDGSRPVPIGTVEVRDYIKANIHPEYTANTISGYDPKTSLCYWFIASRNSTGEADEAIIYSTITGKFGRMSKNVRAIIDFVAPNMEWGALGLGAVAATWGAWPNDMTWNSPEFYGDAVGLSFFGSDDTVYKFESNSSSSSITTGDSGDDTLYSTISRVRPRFISSPDSASMTHYHKTGEGDDLQTGVTVTMDDNKFDLLHSARFHRLKLDFTGNHEISGYEMQLKPNGTR